jgi:hypothetical protein
MDMLDIDRVIFKARKSLALRHLPAHLQASAKLNSK